MGCPSAPKLLPDLKRNSQRADMVVNRLWCGLGNIHGEEGWQIQPIFLRTFAYVPKALFQVKRNNHDSERLPTYHRNLTYLCRQVEANTSPQFAKRSITFLCLLTC